MMTPWEIAQQLKVPFIFHGATWGEKERVWRELTDLEFCNTRCICVFL